jgi:hypothetical protein
MEGEPVDSPLRALKEHGERCAIPLGRRRNQLVVSRLLGVHTAHDVSPGSDAGIRYSVGTRKRFRKGSASFFDVNEIRLDHQEILLA